MSSDTTTPVVAENSAPVNYGIQYISVSCTKPKEDRLPLLITLYVKSGASAKLARDRVAKYFTDNPSILPNGEPRKMEVAPYATIGTMIIRGSMSVTQTAEFLAEVMQMMEGNAHAHDD